MKLTYDRNDGYLLDTEVENIFINEYMVTAPGEYVKVYLYALMCAQMGLYVSFSDIAKALMQSEEDVGKAFLYWKQRGAVRTYKENGEDVFEIASLRSNLFYGGRKGGRKGMDSACCEAKEKASKDALYDEGLASLFKAVEKIVGRPLGGKEPAEICSWMEDFGATPELIEKAYRYCIESYKKDAPSYVGKVVKTWAMKGLLSEKEVEDYLEETERMRFLHRRVFKALGFARNATEEERRIMDVWFNEMNLSIDKVLEACKRTSGISNPNINYIDKVLKNQYKEKNGAVPGESSDIAPGIVLKYYDYIRMRAEAEAKERCEEVYSALPEVKALDDEIRKAGMEMSRVLVSNAENKKEAAGEIRRRTDKMLADKAAILTENGYPADYMEIRFKCKECRDTGTTESGQRCGCFGERTEEAKEWQNSQRTKTSF